MFKQIAKKKAQNFRMNCLARAKKLGIERDQVPMPNDFYLFLLTYEDSLINYRNRLYLTCEYTGERVALKDIELDHKDPVSRGGSFKIWNLCVTSAKINQQKGNMNSMEFARLQDLLNDFDDDAKKDVLARLRAGSSRFIKH
ncbi:HNHc domain containing protein [uncultured Caudovirales phage]|uniref:HNHc domain containing protein n=1 Tax=uncultured Caudovirales phage TaxID=2100421 RepID=A0A6J5LDV5_9CAUD|nr:HNHc domain containing protein [uncultured Caudovirales phage]